MNKTLRYSLFSVLMMVCGFAFGQTTVTFDFTGSEAYGMPLLSGSTSDYNTDPFVCAEGDVTLTLNGRSRWWKASKSNELRFYASSNFVVSVPAGNVVTKVALTATAPANFSANVGSYEEGVWTGAAESVTFSCNITKSNTPITKIEVTYQESTAPVKKDPKLAFSETTVNTTVGAEFTVPTLTKETTVEPVYSSSNEEVATVDAQTGAVTLVSAGTTVITATVDANDEYNSGSASYTLVVGEQVRTEVTDPYTETFETGIGSFTINDVNLSDGLTYVWKHDASYKYMKASAYNKQNYASESWLVSPIIELSSAEVIRYLSFDQCISKFFGTVSEEATLWIREEGGDWKQIGITYPALKEGSNWSDFETQKVSLAGYEGKRFQIGFKYVSTSEAAGTWEIKNFSVNAGETNKIEIAVEKRVAENDIYNLAGRRLSVPARGVNIINGKKVIVR